MPGRMVERFRGECRVGRDCPELRLWAKNESLKAGHRPATVHELPGDRIMVLTRGPVERVLVSSILSKQGLVAHRGKHALALAAFYGAWEKTTNGNEKAGNREVAKSQSRTRKPRTDSRRPGLFQAGASESVD